MPPRDDARDPWAKAPVGELSEQLLPRWFVVLAVVMVPVAIAVAVVALFFVGPDEVPVEARRPPPGPGLTHDVGEYLVGDLAPVGYDAPCPELEGVAIAGTDSDQALLRRALAGVCNTTLPADAEAALEDFAAAGGVIRFGVFEATGVDSAANLDGDPPRILVNAKFVQLNRPRWIAPVVVHDAVVLAGDPFAAETALRAREVEAAVCRDLLGGEEPSRGCDDAAELLALPDPLAALRSVGYR
jgi:hypothetical protein